MPGNVVEITVSAVNETQPAFDEVKEGASEAAGSVDDLSGSEDRLAGSGDDAAGSQDRVAESAKAAGDGAAAAAEGYDAEAASADRAAESSDRLAGSQAASADSAKASGDAQEGAAAKTDLVTGAAGKGGKVLRDLALGAGIAAAGAIYMGVKFQESATQLVTGAGQSAKGLHQVEQGMLALSTQTGTSAKDIEAGMYMIESAGFHGADGLTVLKAAAQGAEVGNAQLADVANVVTSALNAYHLPASKAVEVTNQLVATVASGKMHMQDLATSISNVLPIAASAHISFAQVGGALATMTAQGMTARRASMNLANMIRSIISPSATASAEMQALGINANKLASNVGTAGLTGTLNTMTEAILRSSKGGDALAGSFAKMTPATQTLARGILSGKVSAGELTTATQGLSVQQAALVTQFAKTAGSATGLKTTFDGAMKTMVGGATGLNVALLLSGKHASTFASNVATVGEAARKSGPDVTGWGDITKDAAFKLDQAKTSVEDLGTSVGLALLPALEKVLTPLDAFVGWVGQSKVAVDVLAVAIGGALAGFAIVKAVEGFQRLQSAFGAIQGGLTKLGEQLGILSGEQDAAAVSAEGAAVAEGELDAAMDANPIGLIVLAIAGLVIAFVELWKHCTGFRDFFTGMWHGIERVTSDAVDWIKDHWKLLALIIGTMLLGPIGTLIAFIATHWDTFKRLTGDVVDWVSSHWRLLAEIIGTVLLGPIGALIAYVATHWSQFTALTSRLVTDVTGFFERLPGDILRALASLPGMLYSAGRHAMTSLIGGLTSMIGDLGRAAGGIASKVAGFFGLSPAKEGPLSGPGAPEIRGRHFAQDLARGMLSGQPALASAARSLSRAVALGAGSGGAGYGAGGSVTHLQISLAGGGGGTQLEQAVWTWLRNQVRVKGGGGPNSVQIALGRVA